MKIYKFDKKLSEKFQSTGNLLKKAAGGEDMVRFSANPCSRSKKENLINLKNARKEIELNISITDILETAEDIFGKSSDVDIERIFRIRNSINDGTIDFDCDDILVPTADEIFKQLI